jgi:hypothetical protein
LLDLQTAERDRLTEDQGGHGDDLSRGERAVKLDTDATYHKVRAPWPSPTDVKLQFVDRPTLCKPGFSEPPARQPNG